MEIIIKKKDLRRDILDQTRHQLVSKGYANLSMRKIASAIGCSATSIYLYFENKDALFESLVDEGMQWLLDDLQLVLTDFADEPPSIRLTEVCKRYVAFGLRRPEYYEIMFMLKPENLRRYPVEKYRNSRRNLDIIAALIDEGVESGEFRKVMPRVAATSAWATLHGAVTLQLANRLDIRIDRDDFIACTIKLIIESFKIV